MHPPLFMVVENQGPVEDPDFFTSGAISPFPHLLVLAVLIKAKAVPASPDPTGAANRRGEQKKSKPLEWDRLAKRKGA